MSLSSHLFQPKHPHQLAFLRILSSGYFLLFSFSIREEHNVLLDGLTFKPYSYFHVLTTPLSQSLQNSIFWLWLALTVMVFIGLFTRTALFLWILATILFIGYGYNFGKVDHSLHLISQCMLILGFTRCSDVWSLDSLWKKDNGRIQPHWRYNWPLVLVRTNVIVAMFTLGLQKLYFSGFDWFMSDRFFILVFTNSSNTALANWILSAPIWVSQLLAGFAMIVVELLAPLAFFRPFNKIFPVIWVLFHVGVILLFGGHIAFLSQGVAYLFFYDFDKYIWFNKLKGNFS